MHITANILYNILAYCQTNDKKLLMLGHSNWPPLRGSCFNEYSTVTQCEFMLPLVAILFINNIFPPFWLMENN
uniref:Uncharacterized protein n=2 Tax=Anguilla anguilla TaxID=7936 RepID=A0A0E9RLM8_ANGAN